MRTSALTAGWYPNLDGAPGQRYWDGAEWIIIEIARTSVDPTPSRVSVDERALRRNTWLTTGAAGLIAVWAFAFFAVGGSAGERHLIDTAPGTDAAAASGPGCDRGPCPSAVESQPTKPSEIATGRPRCRGNAWPHSLHEPMPTACPLTAARHN